MEKPVDSDTTGWIDRQLAAALQPSSEFAPDAGRWIDRLNTLGAERRRLRRLQARTAVGLVFAAALVATLPQARVYAVRWVDACVAGGQFVVAKVLPAEKNLSISHQDRRAAPDFELRDSKGALVRLSAFRGQVVLLNFWATWCNPCRLEIPWFVEFQRTHGGKRFTVIGVSLDEDGWIPVRPYVAKQQINYPVVLGKDEVLRAYGGLESLPTTLIIDRQGRVAATHVGLVSRSVYEQDIVAVLREPQ